MTLMESAISIPVHSQLWESVLYSLRLAIVTGELAPGTHLVESQLAEKLGVSRGPVRDALARLEHEGLIINYPYRGKYVAKISDDDIHDIYSMRVLLEGYAVELAIQRFDPSQLYRMQELRTRMLESINERRFEEFADADVEFHRTLVAMGRSDRLLQVWDTLAGVTHAFVVINASYDTVEILAVAGNHDEILAALAQRDVAAAREALRAHLTGAEAGLLRTKAKLHGERP